MTERQLLEEIQKRDKVITKLLMSQVATIVARSRYGSMTSQDFSQAVSDLSYETVDLDTLIQHRIDHTLTRSFEEIDSRGQDPADKAEALREVTLELLSHKYFVDLKNEIKDAVDKKRVILLREM